MKKFSMILLSLVFTLNFASVATAQDTSSFDFNYTLESGKDFRTDVNVYKDQEDPYLNAGEEWVIDDFTTIYTIGKDANVKVDERIWTNFFTPGHGIYRYIPTVYNDDNNLYYNLRLKFISATDELDIPYNIADKRKSDPFYLQLGNADITLTGPIFYRIKYETQRGLRYFDDHDELYWNVTGWDWDVPILNSKAVVILPENVNLDDVQMKCYMGAVDSTEQNCSFKFLDDRTIEFSATRPFNDKSWPKEDFTIAVWLPKGVVTEPSMIKKAGWLFADNWGLFVFPIIVLVILFLCWRKWGKELPFDKAIIPQYEENAELTPAVAGMLLKDSDLENKHLSAEIIYLATKKYLTVSEVINEKKDKVTDYKLIKKNPPDAKLKDFQKFLLDKLFEKGDEILISSFSNKFYAHLPELTKQAGAYCKKYFETGPTAKAVFMALGIILGFLTFFMGGSLERSDIMIGGVVSGMLFIVFGVFMAKKSQAGNEALWYVNGYKMFIETAEKYRAKFYEDQNIFDRILPYAMIFGLADKWIGEFKDIYKQNPDWYQSTRPLNFMLFNSALNSFTKTSNSTLISRPASRGGSSGSSGFSSGGGFSGGGFGGGGGGRW
jgi:uncharacterized membrane protein